MVATDFEARKGDGHADVLPAENAGFLQGHGQGEFTVDSEFAALIPPLSDDERQQLEANVLADGCRDPLVIWAEERILLDGHNRLGICRTHGLEFKTEPISLADRSAARRWIRLHQLGRRNLTAEAAASLRGAQYNDERGDVGGDGSNQHSEQFPHSEGKASNETAERLAKEFNVSRATVERDGLFAEALAWLAERHGEELREKVLSRDARISRKDVLALRAIDDDDERNELVNALLNCLDEERKRGRRKKLSDVRRERAERAAVAAEKPSCGELYEIIHGDIAEACAGLEPGSFDAIVTDPPYPKEFIPLYEVLAEQAARLLRPGGSCVVMCGQSYLPELYALLNKHLAYHWTLAYLTPGGQAVQVWQRKVNTFWKPLLWFTNGKYDGPWIGDVSKSQVNDNDKRFHHWGQSESGMLDIIERITKPGERVLDPFCGASTTGLACNRLKRSYVGIDSDEAKCALSRERLAAEQELSSLGARMIGQEALFREASA